MWLPLMLVRLGVLPEVIPVAALTPVALVGVLVPGVVATLLSARASGRPGVRGLYARLRLWRVGRWWLVVLLMQPVVLLAVAVTHNALGRDDEVLNAPGLTFGTVVTFAGLPRARQHR